MKKIFTIVEFILLISILNFTGFYLTIMGGVFFLIPTDHELLNFKNKEASIILSENGIELGKYYEENRVNIQYRNIPDHLSHALIAAEDERFYIHKGIDLKSLFRVLVKSILLNNKNTGGGSTITQQLVKNMYPRNKSIMFSMQINKIKEIVVSNKMENLFSKEKILTMYLNTVPFGNETYGIGNASSFYFSKHP